MIRLVVRAVGGGLVALGAGAVAPVPADVVAAAYVVYLGLVAAVAIVPAIARAHGGERDSSFERALARRPQAPGRPDGLVRLENQVTMGVSLASDLHARLRPVLADVAAERLRARHGVDLHRNPDGARALLGEEAWALVRPDATAPADRFAAGIPPARLARVLDAVEAL